jgi:ABC-type glycerol-3-phosphate transport system substrate-binding protein
MCARAVILALALVLAPLGAKAADLVVWWEKGQAAEEDQAVREIIAAFEQKTGKQVELVLATRERLLDDTLAAIEAGRSPPTLSSPFTPSSTTNNGPTRGGLPNSRT